MKRGWFWAGILLVVFYSGCGEKTPKEISQPAVSSEGQAKAIDPQTVGAVKGRVFFQGVVPEPEELPIRGNPECSVFHPKGSVFSEELLVTPVEQGLQPLGFLQNVFVYVKEGLEGYSFEPPRESVTIDNKNCLYAPHVMGVQVGQPVAFSNSDPTLHNVHSYPKNSRPWNLGLPFQGMKQTKKFETAEVMVPLKCDVHPWMTGYVGVLPHPYFAVTGRDGGFELKNLPPGEYSIEAWHEKLGVQSQKVIIATREEKEIEFRF